MARTITDRSTASNNTAIRSIAIDVTGGYIFDSYTGSTADTEPIPIAVWVNGAGTLAIRDAADNVSFFDIGGSAFVSMQPKEIIATGETVIDGAGRSDSTTYEAVNAIY